MGVAVSVRSVVVAMHLFIVVPIEMISVRMVTVTSARHGSAAQILRVAHGVHTTGALDEAHDAA